MTVSFAVREADEGNALTVQRLGRYDPVMLAPGSPPVRSVHHGGPEMAPIPGQP